VVWALIDTVAQTYRVWFGRW